MDKGLALLQREHKAGAEDVELIDMVLRSAVKSKRETEVLDVARRWTGQVRVASVTFFVVSERS